MESILTSQSSKIYREEYDKIPVRGSHLSLFPLSCANPGTQIHNILIAYILNTRGIVKLYCNLTVKEMIYDDL